MKLLRAHRPTQCLDQSVVTIGNFDGLHLGHQALLKRVNQLAELSNLASVMISFDPLPKEFFSGKPGRLMSLSEKIQYLQGTTIDYFYCIQFGDYWANLSAMDFMRLVLQQAMGAKYLVVGEDFRFGKNRVGDVAMLKSWGSSNDMQVHVVPKEQYHGERISSSWVRNSLVEGKLERVTALLGRAYSITARVVHGNKLGRALGFPTVNIPLSRRNSVLAGIYVASVQWRGKVYYGAASVGTRPAVCGQKLLLEVHIFDFDHVVYGERITVRFLYKLRDEWDFPDLQALCKQIEKDVEKAKNYCLSHGLQFN